MSKSIVIFGSARSNGHTRDAVNIALSDYKHDFIDLSDFVIKPFDYQPNNHDDDFIPLMKNILKYSTIFIATPIYWYGPSTIMKIFLDRWSDILKEPYKKIGKAICGKKLFVISSNGVSGSQCFEDMFKQICDYMSMHYMGCYNHHSANDERQLVQSKKELIEFKKRLLAKTDNFSYYVS